jgi:hypothetical protein
MPLIGSKAIKYSSEFSSNTYPSPGGSENARTPKRPSKAFKIYAYYYPKYISNAKNLHFDYDMAGTATRTCMVGRLPAYLPEQIFRVTKHFRAIKFNTNTRLILYRAKKICYCFTAAMFMIPTLHGSYVVRRGKC